MTDVLKLAEEALEDCVEAVHSEYCGTKCGARCVKATESILTIRSAIAEWGWRPIAELTTADEFTQSTILGRWGFWCGQPPERWCLGNCGHLGRAEAINSGYMYFCRPQLPPPPAREEVGNA